MFSRRTQWELSQNKIAASLDGLKQGGQKILDLTESNPTRCGFFFLKKDLSAALSNPANMQYAPLPKGMLNARQAIAAYYARQGIKISPERIFLTASTSEGYSFLFRLLADPQDEVLFPSPSYPLFEFLTDINDLTMKYYPLDYSSDWSIDLEAFQGTLSKRSKAVVLVNPNNPTGSYIKRSELKSLNAICRTKGLALISDEVFFDYAFASHDFPILATNNECLTFVVSGISKILALPQMKLSWIIVNGPDELVEEACGRLEVISDTYLSVNTPVQNALEPWLSQAPEIQKEIMKRVWANREFLKKTCDASISLLNSDGGWYGVLKYSASVEEDVLVETLLEQDQVYIHPGYFFNFHQEGHLVVSLLPSEEVFEQGIGKLKERLKILAG